MNEDNNKIKKGFSIEISNEKVQINSFVEDTYDSFLYEDNHIVLLLEGVILNKQKLLTQFAKTSFANWMLDCFVQKKIQFLQDLEGEFRGVVWDKKENKLFVFTNPTATQRVFYSKWDNTIFIDTNLVRLSQNIKKKNIKISPNIDGIYQLLCLTGMLENSTIIENVFKVYDGHFLEIDLKSGGILEKSYFNHQHEPYYNKSKEKALGEMNEVFTESVLLEYQKDNEYKTGHLALLSGGLDSRVAMMVATRNGLQPNHAFCFSQSGYLDEKISRKIASDFAIDYEFVPLDGGVFLNKIDQLTEISEGLVLYLGAIHVQHAMDNLQFQDFSLFHSGQIGDGILGGFNSMPKKEKPSEYKLVFNKDFSQKITNKFQESINKYPSQETCLIRNLAFNRVLLGAHVLQQKAYQTSPFMTKDFMKFAISLPESWKYKHQFYIEWIKKYCPEATQYTWERTLLKPNATWKTNFGDLWVKRPFVKMHDWLLKTPQKASMYPYQYYFDNDSQLQKFYENYFKTNIDRLWSFPELKTDIINLFQSPKFYSKAQAVNILSIFKLFFS